VKNSDFDQVFESWLNDDCSSNDQSLPSVPKGREGEIAERLVVHGLLVEQSQNIEFNKERQIRAALDAVDRWDESRSGESRKLLFLNKYAPWLAAVAVCLVALLFVSRGGGGQALADSFDKVISSSEKLSQRRYAVSVLEVYLDSSNAAKGQQEDLNGATLIVGGRDRYVFIRKLTNGYLRTSGCDGVQSWAMREDGPVHVSSDLNRFLGSVPGHHQSASFVNLPVFLHEVKDKYNLQVIDQDPANGSLLGLRCEKESVSVRGPKVMELWVDQESWVIRRLLLQGMPRARGGAKAVELNLVSESAYSEKFFSHDHHHHEPEREVRTSKKQQ